MATAPTLELCDDLVTQLISTWAPAHPDRVTRGYWSNTGDGEDSESALLDGRKVTIAPSHPTTYTYEPETRGRDIYTHHISVLIEKRYPDPGEPTRAWIDAEVNWVYTYIVLGFDWDKRDNNGPSFNKMFVTVSAETQIFDPDLMRHDRLFSSQVDITFQELVDA